MSNKVYEIITSRIMDQMKQGIIPWSKPWVSYRRVGGKFTTHVTVNAVSHQTGKPYSLINQLLLGRAGEYLTYNQIQAEGGKLKKGSKASVVCFWKQLPVDAVDQDGNPIIGADGKQEKRMIPFLRYYQVFHISDCEGIKAKYADKIGTFETVHVIPADHADHIAEADDLLQTYVSREGIKLVNDKVSDRAFYRSSEDMINLPCIEQFKYASEYYSTAFHEATHSTGHSSRLNRMNLDPAHRWGDSAYSREELVAEIGAASICHSLGISTENSFRNSVAYIQNWLQVLANDPKMVVFAAARAEKAVAYIYGDVETADAEGEE